MESQTFDITGDKLGTKYNIRFVAEHPLKIGTGAPGGDKVLREIERTLGLPGLDLLPITGQVERIDDAWGTMESHGWIGQMPETLILAVAKLLDGFVAQADDPSSDVDVIFDEEYPPAVTIASALIAHRKEVRS